MGELSDVRDADRGFLFGFGSFLPFAFSGVCLVRLGVRALASFFTRFDIRADIGAVESSGESELRRVNSGVVGVGVSVRGESDVGDGEAIGDVTDMMFSFARSSFVGPPLVADDKSTHGNTGLRSSGNQLISKDV